MNASVSSPAGEGAPSTATRRCARPWTGPSRCSQEPSSSCSPASAPFPAHSSLRRLRRSPPEAVSRVGTSSTRSPVWSTSRCSSPTRPPVPRPGIRCSRPFVPMPTSVSTRPATPTLGDDATRSTTPPSPRSWDRACTASTSSPGGPGCAPSSTTCAPRSTGPSIPAPLATPTSRSASSPPSPTNCPWTQQLMSASGRHAPSLEPTRPPLGGAPPYSARPQSTRCSSETSTRRPPWRGTRSAMGCHPTVLHR